MSERSNMIFKLCSDFTARASYIKSKLGVLVPSQIKALRLASNMPRQSDLAREAKMQQSRISMFETPGAANMTIETLSRLAAAFKVGLLVEFVPFSDMLGWENAFSQDSFRVVPIERDKDFMRGTPRSIRTKRQRKGSVGVPSIAVNIPESAKYASRNTNTQGEQRAFDFQRLAMPSVNPFNKAIEIGQQNIPYSPEPEKFVMGGTLYGLKGTVSATTAAATI